MSTFDYPSIARSFPSLLQPGLRAAAGSETNPDQAPLGLPSHTVHAVPAERVGPLDAPLSDVAKLHTEAERSMSTGLPSAIARAVDRPQSADASTAPAATTPSAGTTKSDGRDMQRVREVRREQGISIKRASQHLGISVEEARRQEEPTADLTLSQLFAWQKLCEVPVADLLVEPDCELSAPVLQRARMVRVMKTVQAILERTGQQSVKRLGQTLVNQLIELMPELKGVSSWHAVERRQSCNQNARVLESNYLRPADEDSRD